MPLSKSQLQQLGIAATAAAAHQRSVGSFSVPPDMATASKSAQNEFWRHQQVALATQRVCSFKDMTQAEYRPVMQHLEALAGPAYASRAADSTARVIDGAACDRAPGCHFARELYHWLAKAGYKEGYAIAIMKAKFKGITDIRRLNDYQLKQLHDTVVTRCRAKLKQPAESPSPASQSQNLPISQSQNPPVSKSPAKSRSYTLGPRTRATVATENIPF